MEVRSQGFSPRSFLQGVLPCGNLQKPRKGYIRACLSKIILRLIFKIISPGCLIYYMRKPRSKIAKRLILGCRTYISCPLAWCCLDHIVITFNLVKSPLRACSSSKKHWDRTVCMCVWRGAGHSS